MDDDFISVVFPLCMLLFLRFMLFSVFYNKAVDNAYKNIEEYTALYNECESNYHMEKVISQTCVNYSRYNCFEYHEKEIEVKIYDVQPNNMKCEDILDKYNSYTYIINNEEKNQ